MRKINFKLLFTLVLTIILSVSVTVVANTIINSKEIIYDNNKSKGTYTNVQESIDELYSLTNYTGEEYQEDILHGAYPVLSDELIPVYIKGNGDVYYANTKTEWYSYKYKRWANAVILVDDAYSKNKYSVGDKIAEEDIESYFVWIPRYAYKLWDLATTYTDVIDAKTLKEDSYTNGVGNILGGARIIDITFGTDSYLSGDTYKKLIRNEDGTFTDPDGLEVGQWLVHPGFTLGTEELNGFWIGKFETGYNQTNTVGSAITGTENWTTAKAQVPTGDSSRVIVKPNVFSWRNLNISNMFNTAKGYNTNLKSHMLKNTEWGAVAYLSHSKYGKGAEININNASDYRTGFSALNSKEKTFPGECGASTGSLNEAYNTGAGYLASTTGNITGVYDMSGGNWEYVAAAMINGRTTDNSGLNPEFVTEQMKEGYIDAYPFNSAMTCYSKRILGDATGELGPFYKYWVNNEGQRTLNAWYSDFSTFLLPSGPWFTRGGYYRDGIIGGSFLFVSRGGAADNGGGFRLALAPSVS